jgi:hypothetical protein
MSNNNTTEQQKLIFYLQNSIKLVFNSFNCIGKFP